LNGVVIDIASPVSAKWPGDEDILDLFGTEGIDPRAAGSIFFVELRNRAVCTWNINEITYEYSVEHRFPKWAVT
jgi:hypothetical protein